MHRLALILALTSACVADGGDEGFNIVHNLAPGPACVLSPGGAFLARGIIDKQSTSPYILTPEIVSRISAAEGTTAQRTIALRGAKIEVFDVTGSTKVSKGKFQSLFAASLAPLGSTTAAFDIITTEMIAAAPASGITRAQYLAHITPFGALGGSGDTVDGVPFDYPVTICDGCVATILGACPLAFGTTIPESTPNGCNKFQDGVVACCMSASGPICPPTVDVERFALTVSKAGANAGTATVTSTPAGISCGAQCTGQFASGSSVTLTVAGAANYTWSVTACAANGPCTVMVSAAQNVTLTVP